MRQRVTHIESGSQRHVYSESAMNRLDVTVDAILWVCVLRTTLRCVVIVLNLPLSLATLYHTA